MLVVLAAALGIAALLAMSPLLPGQIGKIDFRAYWSASYLLAHGESPYVPDQMLRLEQRETGWMEDYPMMAWNPPWLAVLLFPYVTAAFERAVWWWLLTNILLLFVSAVAFWQVTQGNACERQTSWVAIAMAFIYVPTLTALIAGQVDVIVLAGLVGFVFFMARQRTLAAGVSLALITVKPQLIYLTLPVVLLNLLHNRCWRTLAGFVATLCALGIVALSLRPNAVWEYGTALSNGQLLDYETPTLSGWLSLGFGWSWAKWASLVILPLTVLVWWRYSARWDLQTTIDTTVLLSIITTPFAWSYDFVVLLIPLWRLAAWMVESRLSRIDSFVIVTLLALANGVMFYERILSPREVYFFWLPLVLALLYGWGWLRWKPEMRACA